MTADEFKRAYDRGFIDALTAYAVWHDGVLTVGANIYTLRQAVERMEQTYNYNPTPEESDVKS